MSKRVWFAGVAVFALLVLGFGYLFLGGDLRPRASVGTVDTTWRLVGSNAKIAVDSFDDPKVQGVACFLSRARAGGISGGLGLAEDTSDASIACRQIGPISFRAPLREGERVFKEHRSLLFKTLQVVRFYDRKHRSLIYLSYSDKLVQGSPKNSISAVALMPWGGAAPGEPKIDD